VRKERHIEKQESEIDYEALEKSAKKLPLDETKIIIVDGYRKRVPLNTTRTTSHDASKLGSARGSVKGGN